MPFVQRIIEPKYLSRTTNNETENGPNNNNNKILLTDYELESVTNTTLCNALRQLASLVLVCDDIFTELTGELKTISAKTEVLKTRIVRVETKLDGYDPKKVTVPEGDISTFALLREHYTRHEDVTTTLFRAETRPKALQLLYEAAAKTPVHAMRQMDRWRRDGHRSSRFFMCTPVLGAKRKRIRNQVDIDIETRMPAAVNDLRRWTSSEAIGDVTVNPNCITCITSTTIATTNDTADLTDAVAATLSDDDEAIDHKLPSPEEQQQVLALKFPAEIIAVDVSGRRFDRMSVHRRSLLHTGTTYEEETNADGSTIRRKSRSKKPRGKRRNTLAGTDQKEIRDALSAGNAPASTSVVSTEETEDNNIVVARSKSTDLIQRTKKSSPPSTDGKKSHFNTLKQWGKNRLKLINRSNENKNETNDIDDDTNIYETVTARRRKNVDKDPRQTHIRKQSYSSSEKSSSISISTPLATAMNIAVKLRDSSMQRRQRRNKDEQHSSSGNWSASSESGRASIGSEITSTTHPKSTTSVTTSNNSLNQHLPGSVNSRRRFVINTSASSSVTSEGTLTPDIITDLHDDGETSSVYSCDTEGYYTSFHVDSGLKTLKEEELGLPMRPLHTTSAFSNSSGNCTVLTAENEYELFGKGSTSTTTSSAGTVCTTLRASESNRSLTTGPTVPERKSSLTAERAKSCSLERDFSSDKTGTIKRSPATSKATVVAAVVHNQSSGDVSPDSGHNTSSSPIESVSSPNGAPSGSEFEFSESSDLEGVERIERIRIKTTINSSRIPSMCVITPCPSDDESVQSTQSSQNEENIGSKNVNRTNLHLPLNTVDHNANNQRILCSGTKMQLINVNPTSGYATIQTVDASKSVRAPSPSGGTVIVKESKSPVAQPPIIKATLLPLNNMFGKLKTNFAHFGHSKKTSSSPTISHVNDKRKTDQNLNNDDDEFDSGEYVTIADVRNNNKKKTEIHYANNNMEYVSLNELPVPKMDTTTTTASDLSEMNSLERNRRQGARVTLDAEGKVVYSSDSLKRRKGAHTTFEPGPFVKNLTTITSPVPNLRTPRVIRPVVNNNNNNNNDLSSQLDKVVIRASPGLASPVADRIRMRPARIVTPTPRPMSPKLSNSRGGAYVHMQEETRGRSLSPAHDEERALSPAHNYQMHLQPIDPYYHHRDYYPLDVPATNDDYYMMQRNSPFYRTLPTYTNESRRFPDSNPQNYHYEYQYDDCNNYGFNSLPRRQQQVLVPRVPSHDSSTKTDHNYFSSYSSSPIQKQNDSSLKISPIDPRNSGEFMSSTPSKQMQIQTRVDLSNKLMSPKKSTMSNEDLYAVIHKSKKKLNIRTDEIDNVSVSSSGSSTPPAKQPETGYLGETKAVNMWAQIGNNSKQSCSDRLGPPKQTSRLDFKKLLLQHGTKSNILSPSSNKLSAVEQLKLSKTEAQTQPTSLPSPMNILNLSSSPRNLGHRKFPVNQPGSPKSPSVKLLSPRSNWKFANPRSDVLSSTILEDCREDESPHSSLEKKSPNRIRIVDCNTNITDNRAMQKENICSDRRSISRAQLLQAQRAEFFKISSPSSQPQQQRMFPPKEVQMKAPSSPTLETAL